MKRLWMFCVLGFSLLPYGDSLSCQYCTSSVSWADCTSRETQVTCASQMDSCYRGLIREDKVTTYFKGCESSVQCDSHCNSAQSSEECQVSCCTGDLCNNATAPSSGPVPTEKPFTCYSCVSMNSWAECEGKQTESECPYAAAPKCLEIFQEKNNGAKFYMKLCGSEESCNRSAVCEDAKECKINCCDNKDCVEEPRTTPAPSAQPLSCEDCHNNGSWAECEKRIACSAGFARCRNIYNKIREKDEAYLTQGCYSEEKCHRMKEDCKKNSDVEACDMHCCTDYLCTATYAQATRIDSGFLISACAAFLTYFAV